MSSKDDAGGFTRAERAAMKERAAELEKERTRGRGSRKAADEQDVLTKIASWQGPDRALAERFHVVVTTHAAELLPKLWYGQPAYARKGGAVVCFFRSGHDDQERYSTIGFTAEAEIDEGGLWATSFAVTRLDEAAVETVARLVRAAA